MRKMLMTYDGTTCKTELLRTSLSAIDKVFSLQELILLHTLSFMNLNIDFLLLLIMEDSPKYLPVPRPILTSKRAAKCC